MKKEYLTQCLITIENEKLFDILEEEFSSNIKYEENRKEFEIYSNSFLEDFKKIKNKIDIIDYQDLIDSIIDAQKENVYQFIFEYWEK
jgi:hypothetical protein